MENSKSKITDESKYVPAAYNISTGKVLLQSPLSEERFIAIDRFKDIIAKPNENLEIHCPKGFHSQSFTICKTRYNNKTGESEEYDCRVVFECVED